MILPIPITEKPTRWSVVRSFINEHGWRAAFLLTAHLRKVVRSHFLTAISRSDLTLAIGFELCLFLFILLIR